MCPAIPCFVSLYWPADLVSTEYFAVSSYEDPPCDIDAFVVDQPLEVLQSAIVHIHQLRLERQTTTSDVVRKRQCLNIGIQMKKPADFQIHETNFWAYGGYISGRRVSIKRRYHSRFIFTGVQNRFVQFRLPLNCVIIVIDEDPVHNTWVCSVGVG